MSLNRIRQWHETWDGGVYVAFSGGADSTVLLDLARMVDPDIPAVFYDTGLEFPEIRSFALSIPGVERIRPKHTFRSVIDRWGYPLITKRMAQYIHEVQTLDPASAVVQLRMTGRSGGGRFRPLSVISQKWKYVAQQTEIRVSHRCCEALKKGPARIYERRTNRKPIIGTMAEESHQRRLQWALEGCNSFGKAPKSKPMSFWLKSDVWAYIRGENPRRQPIPYSTIYDMGYTTTGCVFCCFGCHLEDEPNRFQLLERTHPKLHAYCMKPWDQGGLGLVRPLELIGVPWHN